MPDPRDPTYSALMRAVGLPRTVQKLDTVEEAQVRIFSTIREVVHPDLTFLFEPSSSGELEVIRLEGTPPPSPDEVKAALRDANDALGRREARIELAKRTGREVRNPGTDEGMDLDSVAHVLESDGRVLGVLAIVRRKPLLLDKTRQGLFYAIADEAAKGLAQRYVHPPVADARFDAEKRRVGTRKVERSRLDALRALAEKTFVGEGQRHDAQLELMARYAESKLAVLILGETGTGKECTARLIHAASPRRKGPFIVHNVGAVSASLFEAEFFGHKKGAFTGATESRLGHVRSAEGGTLFLDEVGEIPPELQKKLLRVVQDGKLTPVGESKEISVDVRVIAATNVDLPQSVVDHEFREDLFFRLSALMIKLLPLRERMGELELFVVHILEACGEEGRGRTLTPAAWEKLRAHKWRGNFRDLQQTIQGALLLAGPSGPIDAEHIVLRVLPEPSHPKKEPVTFDLVVKTLEQCGGSRKRAAEILGVVPRHISRVLAEGR